MFKPLWNTRGSYFDIGVLIFDYHKILTPSVRIYDISSRSRFLCRVCCVTNEQHVEQVTCRRGTYRLHQLTKPRLADQTKRVCGHRL